MGDGRGIKEDRRRARLKGKKEVRILPVSYLVASSFLVRRRLNRFKTSLREHQLEPGVIPVIWKDQRRGQAEGGEEGDEKEERWVGG